jgi:hypothetical protein
MPEVGKLLVVLGAVMVVAGILLWSGLGWLTQLPGDINYNKGNFSFHFPIVTCILISLVLTVLMWLFRK